MKQFQCALTADSLQRMANLAIFDSLVVQVEVDDEPDDDEQTWPATRRIRAAVFLYGKMIARSEWQ